MCLNTSVLVRPAGHGLLFTYDRNAASLEVIVNINNLPRVNCPLVPYCCDSLFLVLFFIRFIMPLLLCNIFVPDSLLSNSEGCRERGVGIALQTYPLCAIDFSIIWLL